MPAPATARATKSASPNTRPNRDSEQELAELIYATAQSDQTAFSRLYDLTNRVVFSLALRPGLSLRPGLETRPSM